MVKLKREVSASLFRCTHRNSIARSVPDISRMFPDYPGSFLIVITFSVKRLGLVCQAPTAEDFIF